MRVLGIDLAWSEGMGTKRPNETGVVAADLEGNVLDAGWVTGLDETIAWIQANRSDNTLAMIDAPLMVTNPDGQRLCEKHVSQRYGRWMVFANSTHLGRPHLAGQTLRILLEAVGWTYDSGD